MQIPYETIMNMDYEELHKQLKIYELEGYKVEETIKKLRFGIDIKFDIFYLKHPTAIRFQRIQAGIILIFRKSYNASDVFTEIENRQAIARKTILEINEQQNSITAGQ